jgi:hypothetical protein
MQSRDRPMRISLAQRAFTISGLNPPPALPYFAAWPLSLLSHVASSAPCRFFMSMQ